MDTELLRAFLTVVAERSFVRAADRLGIAPSTLTDRIKKLERLAGTTLLDRQPVAPTVAGERLAVAAEQAVSAADGASRRLAAIRSQPGPELRVGVLSHGGGPAMVDLVRAFRYHHPGVVVRLVALGFSQTATAVLDGEVDVAFVRPRLDDDRLEEFPLATEERYVILPTWDERAHLPALSHTDLERDVFLTPSPGAPAAYRSFLHLLPERNHESPRLFDSQCHYAEEFLTAIAAGLGLGITIASFARHYRWPGIAYVPLTDAKPAATTVIVAGDDRRAAVRDFTQLLAA